MSRCHWTVHFKICGMSVSPQFKKEEEEGSKTAEGRQLIQKVSTVGGWSLVPQGNPDLRITAPEGRRYLSQSLAESCFQGRGEAYFSSTLASTVWAEKSGGVPHKAKASGLMGRTLGHPSG